MPDHTAELDLTQDPDEVSAARDADAVAKAGISTTQYDISEPYDPNKEREGTRGDLARGLLWLLAFVIGGVVVFVGLGRLDGSVITQSIFPSLIALAGTALGFYFGSESGKSAASFNPTASQPLVFTPVSTDPATKTSSATKPSDSKETVTKDEKTTDTDGG